MGYYGQWRHIPWHDLVSNGILWQFIMMTSSNGNIFRVTGLLCGEFPGPGEFPAQWPVTRSFEVFFDLRPDKRLSKQSWGWWSETPSSSLWRHRNVVQKTTQKHVVKWLNCTSILLRRGPSSNRNMSHFCTTYITYLDIWSYISGRCVFPSAQESYLCL